MKTFFNKTAATIAVIGTVLMGSNAIAADNQLEQESRTVSYADLNLASPSDQDKLHARMRMAAKSVCDLDNTRRLTASQQRAGRECFKAAMEEALANVPTHASAIARAGS
jgi:UrcA family protein